MSKIANLIIIIQLMLAACGRDMTVRSPGGGNTITLELTENGSLVYSVRSGGITALEKSSMGVMTGDHAFEFSSELSLVESKNRVIDETYTLPTGKRSTYVNRANETTCTFRNRYGKKLDVICRAYDDGVAFRYITEGKDKITITKENTMINLPAGTMSWMMDYVSHYENFYPQRLLDTIGIRPLSFPALTRVNGKLWMLLTEASVYDQPGTHLVKTGNGNELSIQLPEDQYTVSSRWESPWRVFIVGENLATIVESVMVENLNPPSCISDISWIKPGVAVFPWWGNFLANSYIDTLKMYVDLAAEMNWEWIEFDVSLVGSPFHASKQWETTNWLPEFTAYARSRGISVYGWDEISTLRSQEDREYVYGRYKELGISGIKIDYIESDRQEAMTFRTDATADAAGSKLMVSFHGETVPRGQRRSYPNIMTLEGVRGAEYYALKGHTPPTPEHNCTLPFTRNVVGPMDYTPVTFTIREENPRKTTYAHELALGIIVESGWLVMADRPHAYLNSPAKDILSKLESSWDEIRFIEGYPAEYVCLARRKGDRWFIAGINAGKERILSIPLDFMQEEKISLTIFEDKPGEELTGVNIRTETIGRDRYLTIKMAPNGGFAAFTGD